MRSQSPFSPIAAVGPSKRIRWCRNTILSMVRLSLREIVENEENSKLVGNMKVGKQGIEILLAFGIDAIRWFVKGKDMRVADKGPGDEHPLLLSSRKITKKFP